MLLLLLRVGTDISRSLDPVSSLPVTRRASSVHPSPNKPTRTNLRLTPRQHTALRHPHLPAAAIRKDGLSLRMRRPLQIPTCRTTSSSRHTSRPRLVPRSRSIRLHHKLCRQGGRRSLMRCSTKWARWRSVQMVMVSIRDSSRRSRHIRALARPLKYIGAEYME